MKVIDLKNSAEPKRISANCRALSEETGRELMVKETCSGMWDEASELLSFTRSHAPAFY